MTPAPGHARLRGFGWQPVGRRAPVVAGVDLTVTPGERVLLAGPSGAGKTTILHALAGVLGAVVDGDRTGEVEVGGRAGLLQQDPTDSFVAARIDREIAFGPENLGLPRDEIARRVAEAREAVALPYSGDRPIAALSGGEAQRLALAGVLALRPDLLLLDEPTAMLDEHHAAEVRSAVDRVVRASGASLVVVEHRIGPWLDLVDRLVVIGPGGELVADGDPHRVLEQHGARLAAAGVWVPGVPDPLPIPVPSPLVAPEGPVGDLEVLDLAVELVRRGLRGTTRTRAVAGVSARLGAGLTTVLAGPSGSGKSTLLAVAAGLVRPTAGEVRGTSGRPYELAPELLAAGHGWVPQVPGHGMLTSRVEDEVALTSGRLGRRLDVEAVLDVFGLGALAGRHPHRLSGGEQRRLAVAAALAHRPGACLLDEPTVGQDRLTWAAVVGWATSAAAAGATVVAASHDGSLLDVADEVVTLGLEQGRTR